MQTSPLSDVRYTLTLALLCTLFNSISSLSVNISYSFYLPKKLGVATPSSAGCCQFANLPDNNTFGMIPPTVFGIGTQKGGTTTLYAYFQRHPLIHGTTKELHYLDAAGVRTETGLKAYLSRWAYNKNVFRANTTGKAKPAPLKGPLFEISPSYLLVPYAACRAKHIAPNGKYIVLLRDPTSRAYSGYSYTSSVVRRKHKPANFLKTSFLTNMQLGLHELKADSNCNFHSGNGVKSYNDCMGCVLRSVPLQKFCQQRPFVQLTNSHLAFECTRIGKEVILRGMYGPQLAWWFTLLPPSQFKIYNSADFFKSPEKILVEIVTFLGLSQEHTTKMLVKKRKANKGHYRPVNIAKVEIAKNLLREYYKRPNLELYRLMHETGHLEFKPFEKELQNIKSLDCSKEEDIKSEKCGYVKFPQAPKIRREASVPVKPQITIEPAVKVEKVKEIREAAGENMMRSSIPKDVHLERVEEQSVELVSKNVSLAYSSSTRLYKPLNFASDYYMHLIFGVVLIMVLLYGIRLTRKRFRKPREL